MFPEKAFSMIRPDVGGLRKCLKEIEFPFHFYWVVGFHGKVSQRPTRGWADLEGRDRRTRNGHFFEFFEKPFRKSARRWAGLGVILNRIRNGLFLISFDVCEGLRKDPSFDGRDWEKGLEEIAMAIF